MKDRDQLEDLINKAKELLDRIQNYQGHISQNITPEVLAEIERLKRTVSVFTYYNKKTFEDAKLDFKKLEEEVMNSKIIDPEDLRFLEKVKEVKEDAEGLHASYSRIETRRKTPLKKTSPDDPLKKQMKERRKKFKKIGGDNWIPQ